MQKRSSFTRKKSSSISRSEARKAVLGVKTSRASTAKKTSRSGATAASFVERYLGHFGAGPGHAASKGGARKAGAAKKSSTAKKSAAVKKSGAKKSARVYKKAG
jgi:hypothetical protein